MFNNTRRNGYRVLSILNDANAVSRGPKAVAKRAVRKSAWRVVARILKAGL